VAILDANATIRPRVEILKNECNRDLMPSKTLRQGLGWINCVSLLAKLRKSGAERATRNLD
jgi:hypothetical protein